MSRIAVTGGSGKLGRAVIRELAQQGHELHNFDLVAPGETLPASFTRIDFTDFGQTVEALAGIDSLHDGVDAVVHLAAIPGAAYAGNAKTFVNNLTAAFHVYSAARSAGIERIVWASSETLLGYPFRTPPPYVPLDEQLPPTPEVDYALAKDLEEEMARQFCRWDSRLTMVGLRFSNVVDEGDYPAFPAFDADPTERMWNLWSYVDTRDGAQAVRLALELEATGAHVFIIANADTVMTRWTTELLDTMLPRVERRREYHGNESLLSIDKARRELGYEPVHSWRDTTNSTTP